LSIRFLNLSAAEAALLLVGSSTRAYLKSSIASGKQKSETRN